jgi:hypothetical protein
MKLDLNKIKKALEMGIQAAEHCRLNATAHIREMKEALFDIETEQNSTKDEN